MVSVDQAEVPSVQASWRGIDVDSVVSGVVINMLTLAMPLALLQVFDRVIPNGSYGTLFGIFLAMLGVITIDLLLKVARAHFVLEAARQRGHQISMDVTQALFEGSPKALDRLGKEATVERLMGLLGLRQAVQEQVVKVTVDLVFSGLFLLIIAGLGGWLVLAPLSVMLGLLIFAATLRPAYRDASRKRREYDRRRMSFLSEVLQQSRLVKLLGLEHQMLRRYELLQASSSVSSEKLIRLSGGSIGAASMGAQIATVLTCAAGGVLAIQSTFSVAELAACMLLTGRAVQPVIQLTFLSAARDDAAARFSGLAEVADARTDDAHRQRDTVSGGLSVTNLGLRREDGSGFHFRNVSFSASPGQLVVVDGPLSSRRGCLLQLLAGELQPDEGSVFLDGYGRLETSVIAAPQGLVFEPREPVILEGKILQNLTGFSLATPPDNELQKTALELGLARQIAQLPDGLQSTLSSDRRGTGSPGFYRRLALTRALAQRPHILLLEDPLSDLDPTGQRAVAELLISLKGRMTCVLTRPDAALRQAADCTVTLRPEIPKSR
ncbi:ABC-type bacteriocin/lantibiotic exporter [Phaeobacter piscinae]|uniref:ABC-type bacteriocin/lantibiotic exporter n=2 Tax=Phaeobacter TaxID=302485 RepID=A0AAN1GUJ8_9RHOB|nr:ABC transporter transmembrane domain-containing protein [Phaeobacter piscinae]ATG45326.1 ABC-type bacteriocin/lantibiotic exporter [Phaeobacter piscinae]AUR37639.1 ABC-type bacteriocin/lantibiotic exporter [Phaeobacter piscinae]